MATNLQCPNCGEDLGKDTECPKECVCSNCGEEIKNPYGYD